MKIKNLDSIFQMLEISYNHTTVSIESLDEAIKLIRLKIKDETAKNIEKVKNRISPIDGQDLMQAQNFDGTITEGHLVTCLDKLIQAKTKMIAEQIKIADKGFDILTSDDYKTGIKNENDKARKITPRDIDNIIG